MTNDLTKLSQPATSLPAAFAGKTAAPVFKDHVYEKGNEGVTSGYGVLKLGGSKWSLQYKGEEHFFLRPDDGTPSGAVDVVFVRAATTKSKTYYTKYIQGSKERPVCWSNDAVTPAADVPPSQKQASACGGCPMNSIGSRITDDGKKAKACSDAKRTAVMLTPELSERVLGYPLAEPIMFRIPAASLVDFGSFAESMDRKGYPLPSFVARLTFDPEKKFPKVNFTAVRPLEPNEGVVAHEFHESTIAQRIVDGSGFSAADMENGMVVEATGNGDTTFRPDPPPSAQQATVLPFQPQLTGGMAAAAETPKVVDQAFEEELQKKLDALMA